MQGRRPGGRVEQNKEHGLHMPETGFLISGWDDWSPHSPALRGAQSNARCPNGMRPSGCHPGLTGSALNSVLLEKHKARSRTLQGLRARLLGNRGQRCRRWDRTDHGGCSRNSAECWMETLYAARFRAKGRVGRVGRRIQSPSQLCTRVTMPSLGKN